MQPENLKKTLTALHLIRAGLSIGLLTKKEIIEWADKIIIQQDEPDIFFIDLALSNSKSEKDILHSINNYLSFDNPVISGRPLLAMLYKEYKREKLNLEQTVSALFQLKYEAIFTEKEESYIYSIDYDYECARDNIYGTLKEVQDELEKFLNLYNDYSIENFEEWQALDNALLVQ